MSPAAPRRITVSTAAAVSPASRDTGEQSRSHYRTDVPVGVLDETAKAVFTHGQCHAAAAALAEQDGWGQVVVVIERDHYHNGRHSDTINHCYAVAPNGEWVDVNGEHEPEGAIASWDGIKDRPLFDDGHVAIVAILTDADGARGLTSRPGCLALGINTYDPLLPTSMPLARSIVPRVRERLDRDHNAHR